MPSSPMGLELHHGGDVVSSGVNVGIPEHDERAKRGVRDELELGFEHDAARALRAHQRAGHVETLVRHQLFEVEAGDAARDIREPGARTSAA
jgi:hypothetical protein